MPHAPMRIGQVTEVPSGVYVQVLVLRPCRCGVPLAQSTFIGADRVTAYRAARAFIEAVTPPEGEAE